MARDHARYLSIMRRINSMIQPQQNFDFKKLKNDRLKKFANKVSANPEKYTIKVEDIPEVIDSLEEAADRKKPFFKRVKAFIKGENKAGRKVGQILDFATIFVPYGKQIDSGRDIVESILIKTEKTKGKNMPKETTMIQKILSIKNFVNVRDENGDISIEEIGASAAQLLIAVGVVWGSVELGIWEEVSEFLTSPEVQNTDQS